MKKILTFLAVAIVAAASQAASLEWGGFVMNSADPNGADTAAAGSIFGLYQLSDAVAASAITEYNKDTGALTVSGATATLRDTHTLDDIEAGEYAFQDTYGGSGVDVNGNWAVVIYDPASPDVFGVTVYSVSGVTETGQSGSILDTSWAIGGNMGGTVTGGGTPPGPGPDDPPGPGPDDPPIVPEPTTVALLALGLAAFGLKRKIA